MINSPSMSILPSTPAREPRYVELDSLRGLAALSVVLHHFRLMWFGFATGPSPWYYVVDPFTRGREAVMLFFLLSGFVLSIPYLRGKGQPYPAYLLRRILRIYAPYLFALALSVAGVAIWHGPIGHGWYGSNTWYWPVNAHLVAKHVLMIGNYDWIQYNTAFWSLVVEMRVSIIFPLLFLFVRRIKPAVALLLAFAVAYLAARHMVLDPQSARTFETIRYIPIFVCGIVFAGNLERVNAWWRGMGGRRRFLMGLSAFLIYFWGSRFVAHYPRVYSLDQWVATAAAAVFMILAINASAAQRVLRTVVARFLGRISYSLYLVHGTVLFALTHALGARLSILTQFLIYVPSAVLLAYGFCVAVEEPFLRLSRRAGRRAQAAVTETSLGTVAPNG
jgi:peptidoglycan/LPS O-acetylase OafA/YrhL